MVRTRLQKIRGKVRTKISSIDFTSYLEYVQRVLFNPTYILFFGFSAYLCFNYLHAHKKSHLWLFVEKFVKQFTSLADAKCSVLGVLLCFIPFLPVIVSVSPKQRTLAILCTFAYYVFIPEKSPYEYLAHGIIVFLILHTNNRGFRYLGVALLFLTYIMQFVFPLPTPKTPYTCKSNDLSQ